MGMKITLFKRQTKPLVPASVPVDWRDLPANQEYLRVVNDRVLRLLWEVIREYEQLGLSVHTGSYLLHEEAIRIGHVVNQIADDRHAKQGVRLIVRKYVRKYVAL